MSRVEMIPVGGDAEPVAFSNSWRCAAFIWEQVQQHLGWSSEAFERSGYRDTSVAPWIHRSSQLGDLWGLHENERIPDYDRIALAWTFDRVWTPAPLVPRVAQALRRFDAEHGGDSHLPAIADAMESAVEAGADGICMYHNSVSENPWWEWDEEADDAVFLGPRDGESIADALPDLFPERTP